jgi:F-type H+-transporting ATPase subunit a
MHMTTRSRGLVLTLGLLLALGAPTVFASDEHPATTSEHVAAQPEPGATEAPAHGGGGHEGGHAAVPHLQNVLGLVISQMNDAHGQPTPAATFLRAFLDPIFSLVAVLFLGILFVSIGTRMRDRDPGRLQLAAEIVIGGLYGLFEQILGKEARRFTPYLGTLFLFILVNNYMGLLPLGHSSTSSFANTTIGLGVLTFFYAQYVGIKENGILGYLYHFAGQPKSGIEWGFAILIFPLELMGELIKPLSLSLRLFGNIFGEDTLLAVMVMLGTTIVFSLTNNQWIPGLPLQFPFYLLSLLAGAVQALVFTLLSTIYIALMLPHGHDEAEGDAHSGHLVRS